MELLTSYQGKNHLTSQQFRSIIESITGTESYIGNVGELLECELATNNTLKIRSGILIHHGGVMQVNPGTYDEVTYQNGNQAMKRIDLVVARYTKEANTGIESSEWVVIQGTPDESSPVAPAYTEGNMQNGDLVDDCPVFELHFDGINVTEVKKLVPVVQSNSDLSEKIDGLVEFGSNANGYYRKYADGTLECWMNISVTDQAANAAYGSLYVGTRNWTYPVPFLEGENPTCICGSFKWDTGASWGCVRGGNNKYAILSGMDIVSRATGTQCLISAYAIGRWKE